VPLPITREGSTGSAAPSASPKRRKPDLTRWERHRRAHRNPEGEVTIAIVGKYTG
jgi:CTP synthase (UTP-ammonia lyase)